MSNKIILNELLEIIERNQLCIVSRTLNGDTNYQLMKKSTYSSNEVKFNVNGSYKVTNFDFDFFKLNGSINNSNSNLELNSNIQLELLTNLLKKDLIPLEKIKKITLDRYNSPYRSWNDLKHLFLYNKEDISIILEKYQGGMNNDTLSEILNKIVSNDNPIQNLIFLTENHINKLKNNQINFIQDFFLKNTNEKNYSILEDILVKNNKILKESSLFEEKENKFEYLNLNVELFMKKFYFTKPSERFPSADDYEKITKDTLSFLKSHKKKLDFENIYFENRATSKNEFLISIETKDCFNKDLIKKVFLEYVQLYVNEINKTDDKTASWIFSAHKKLKDNKETVSNFIFLTVGLESKEKKNKSIKI